MVLGLSYSTNNSMMAESHAVENSLNGMCLFLQYFPNRELQTESLVWVFTGHGSVCKFGWFSPQQLKKILAVLDPFSISFSGGFVLWIAGYCLISLWVPIVSVSWTLDEYSHSFASDTINCHNKKMNFSLEGGRPRGRRYSMENMELMKLTPEKVGTLLLSVLLLRLQWNISESVLMCHLPPFLI